MADLNKFYKANPALYEVDFEYTGFEWIDCHRADDSTITFLRKAKKKDDYLLVHCNFTPVVREDYWIGVPELCFYEEVFNSDSEYYGGTNVGTGGVMATAEPSNGRPYSIRIKTPPLGVSVFKPKRKK